MFSRIKDLYHFLRYGNNITKLTLSKVEYGQILKGKRIIITGGSDGIGLCMAKKFISVGEEVLITGRTLEKLEHAKGEINCDRLKILQWDISEVEKISAKFNDAIQILGDVDILINNAAFLTYRSNDLSYFDKNINTNFRAMYVIHTAAIEYFLKTRGLHKIINISSSNSFKDDTNAYSLSKKGVNEITKGFAKEYASRNILINAIAPGYTNASINKMDVDANAFDKRNRIHRIITPEDVAELATFLCSDASNAIVGQIIGVDGGVYLSL